MATSSYHPVGSSSSSPAPPPPQLRSFDTIRRSVKSLEAQLDGHLTRYSSAASQIARGFDSDPLAAYGGSNGKAREQDAGQEQWKTLEETIEKALAELQGSLSSLTAILDDPELPPSNLQLHAVQRHREILYDFERDYRRSKDNVRHAIDRRELLGGMKGEAEAYKTTDEDALLAERGRLDNSHSMIDGTLEQAYATLTDFRGQGQILSSMGNRLSSTAASIPTLNGIMTMIGRRKRRDSLIMGTLIGLCTVALLTVLFR